MEVIFVYLSSRRAFLGSLKFEKSSAFEGLCPSVTPVGCCLCNLPRAYQPLDKNFLTDSGFWIFCVSLLLSAITLKLKKIETFWHMKVPPLCDLELLTFTWHFDLEPYHEKRTTDLNSWTKNRNFTQVWYVNSLGVIQSHCGLMTFSWS